MKAKDYRLQTVLKMRGIARDEAGRKVARRIEELDDAKAELSRRQSDLLACYEKQDQKQSAIEKMLERGTRARKVVEQRAFMGHLRESEQELKEHAENQKKLVVRAEDDLDSARNVLIGATKDFKAIETHKSKWTASVRTAAARRDQKTSDEIGSILHGRKKER